MHILAISQGIGFDAPNWRRVLQSGIDAFMIREKQLDARALLDVTRRCQELAPGLPLWINARLDVALATGSGLHLPEAYPEVEIPNLPLSRPLHAPHQFPTRASASQLLVSPVFPVTGKGMAWGVEGLHTFLERLPPEAPRILALGGVDPSSAPNLAHPRLDGLALIRGLWETQDPAHTVAELRVAWA